LGVYLAVAIVAAVVAAGVAIGVALTGGDVLTPVSGAAVVALYGCAIAGVGIAGGGLAKSSVAAPVAAAVTVATLVLDIIVPALKLPDFLHQLALTAHFGEPMVGHWDFVGILVSLALAIGGLAVGAWGLARRDLRN